MSTNLIDEMTEREAKSILNDICHLFKIGSRARTKSTILTNIENVSRREKCLSKIEHHLTATFTDEDGEKHEDQLLNWGENPDQYLETFKKVTAT